jgi:hypothetical protein
VTLGGFSDIVVRMMSVHSEVAVETIEAMSGVRAELGS